MSISAEDPTMFTHRVTNPPVQDVRSTGMWLQDRMPISFEPTWMGPAMPPQRTFEPSGQRNVLESKWTCARNPMPFAPGMPWPIATSDGPAQTVQIKY